MNIRKFMDTADIAALNAPYVIPNISEGTLRSDFKGDTVAAIVTNKEMLIKTLQEHMGINVEDQPKKTKKGKNRMVLRQGIMKLGLIYYDEL